jgi:hypothetical protein
MASDYTIGHIRRMILILERVRKDYAIDSRERQACDAALDRLRVLESTLTLTPEWKVFNAAGRAAAREEEAYG